MKNTNKAFTLIELIVVLVILAVIALIATPIILNIVDKAQISANKRSVDAYGKAIELAVTEYLLDTGDYPTTLDDLEIKYSGNEVVCNIKNLNEDGSIYLSECSVDEMKLRDSSTEDGYYHYGSKYLTNEGYVDKYGDALTSALNKYMKQHGGSHPTDLDSLTLNYKSNKSVTCSLKEINNDGSIYLSECKVRGVGVKDSSNRDGWYHYGEQYIIGDKVTYNGMDFYVIAPSDDASESVTLLKAKPLTVDEVNTYGVGHINKYTDENQGTASDHNGYGGMAYYSSATCGIGGYDGCIKDYDASEVKYAVDAWATDKFNPNDLTEDSLGYKARLITYDELINNLGYDNATGDASYWKVNPDYTPYWVYRFDYSYWTMSPEEDSAFYVWSVGHYGSVGGSIVCGNYGHAVRPVVTILKSAL